MTGPINNNHDKSIEEAVQQFVDAQLQDREPDIDQFVKQYPELQHRLRQRILNIQKIDRLFDSIAQVDENDFEDTVTGHELVGRKIGGFEIVDLIGRGGMGVVYLAHDTKLDRSVAIKSIPAKLADGSTARRRLYREAKLLASLNHPNIAVIHDIIEQDEDLSYLILEYVPGESLAQRIAREPLKLDEALSIARQIALAVSAAHEKGVIHRDLKPGNIKLTPDGRVKVLDFGLAKTTADQAASQDSTITQPGSIIGTPAYMSPEQIRGYPTDTRTDIWSFGSVIYEMLTGKRPFEGKTISDTVARTLEREPDWQALPQQTPANICALLRRCLEKDPPRRLQHIEDAAIEIRETLNLLAAGPPAQLRTLSRGQLLGGLSPARIESLAVLPLENLSGDPQQEYFADGMTEALIVNLGKIGALQVRSRTSIMQYKDVKKPLPEIARELNVDAVVEGTVLRVGEQVRITAQLIHAATDTHLWVDSYERDMGDVLALQKEVARAIARKIKVAVTPTEEIRLAGARRINPETYKAYLRGMFYLNKSTPEGTEKGLDYLHKAIAHDPADPLAYGGLALGYVASAHAPGAPPDALPRAEAAALRALELDETLAEAHAALAHIKLYRDWDWPAAEHAFQRALKLNPSLVMTRAHYSFYLHLVGRTDEAFAEIRRVQQVDPLTPLWPAWQGWQYWWAGQYDEAIAEARKSLQLDSDSAVGLYVLGSAYAAKGMYEEAVKAHQRAAVVSRTWKSALGRTYAMAGRQDEARLVLAELKADPTPWDTWFIAQIYAVMGDNDETFRWLQAACETPTHPYAPWIRHPPAFKPLHDDPRFHDLLRRINLLRENN